MSLIFDSFVCAIRNYNLMHIYGKNYVYYIGNPKRIYKNFNHKEIYLDDSYKLYICKNQYKNYRDFNDNLVTLVHFRLVSFDGTKWYIEDEECNCC